MLAAFLTITFIGYSIGLFWLHDWQILAMLFLANLVILVALGRYHDWRKHSKFLLRSCCFVGFVVICNLLCRELEFALLVGARLFLALLATYSFSCALSPQAFAQGLAYLFVPLRLFGVNMADLAVTITIALSFIPLLSREAQTTRQALRAKGFEFNLYNAIHQPQIYVTTYFDSVFDQVEIIERTLRSKSYE